MPNELSYTIEEVAKLLKVSKLTVYDLVKKGKLPVFKVGRQMRMHAADLDQYISAHKTSAQPSPAPAPAVPAAEGERDAAPFIISGQDIVLDILGKYLQKDAGLKTLRSNKGSLNGLISLYNGESDVVSLHMFDGDTGAYNLPYIKRILVGYPYVLLNLLSRKAGIYVQKGNPLQIRTWADLGRKDLTIINREKGSGARILLDEQLRLHHLPASEIQGYENEESDHIGVASAVAAGKADAGVGIEKAAKVVGVDFLPLITERYDVVMLKTPKNEALIQAVKAILGSEAFQSDINAMGGYDTSMTGNIMHETY